MADRHREKDGSHIPQLVTEGVSDYLTDYKRPGYTEDSLRQFVVLDDIEEGGKRSKRKRIQDDEGDEGEGEGDDSPDEQDDEDDSDDDVMSEGSSVDDSETSDVPLDEVDMMLEEGLPEDYKAKGKLTNGKHGKKNHPGPFINRRLQVIDEIFTNPFDVLPEGWVKVTHSTGIPIYLHKDSRVCTTAMPYFLGPGSARKHRVPLSAIPCLQYRKALDKEKTQVNSGFKRENDIDAVEESGEMKATECPFKSPSNGQENSTGSDERTNENGPTCDVGQIGNNTGDLVVLEPEEVGTSPREIITDDGPKAKKIRLDKVINDEIDDNMASSETVCENGGNIVDEERAQEGEQTAGDEDEMLNTSSDKGGTDKELLGTSPVAAGTRALPKARIETAQENQESQSINHIELREYCQRLFRYRTIDVMRFKTWSERRRFAKVKRKERQLQRPSLPEGTKLITFPIVEPAADDAGTAHRMKKEWIMNPSGKSYVCILHECVQHALKTQPVYEFKDLENPATPYSATVSINKMKYGTGVGTSKRQAKSEAARATLEVLIPEMREKLDEDLYRGGSGLSRNQHTDLSFFDDIKIQDPRVHEFCAKTTEPSPYTILLTCLKRNFGLGDMDITCDVKMLRHQRNEFTMTVGNHTATVVCKNKREGKQRASQAILQAMHPHITSWGSLLRLYGNRSVKTLREKKQEEQEITTLQSRASANSPNWAILNKLKEAMQKLRERDAAVKPLGTFIPPSNVDLPPTSASNLNNLEL